MLVEISNKNTNKQEVYTLLISFQYKESDYLESNFKKNKKNMHLKGIFPMPARMNDSCVLTIMLMKRLICFPY